MSARARQKARAIHVLEDLLGGRLDERQRVRLHVIDMMANAHDLDGVCALVGDEAIDFGGDIVISTRGMARLLGIEERVVSRWSDRMHAEGLTERAACN